MIPRERDGLRVVHLTEALAGPCAALERACFPHADPAEILSEADLRASARTFPEGFFVVLAGDEVVAQAGGIFLDFDWDHPQHRIVDLCGEHQCGAHDPAGAWYYGTDLAVHNRWRGRGLARWLYNLRKELVFQHRKRGILAGAHLPGFALVKHELSADQYITEVAAGHRHDATLSVQLRNGFVAVCALRDYLADSATDGWAALIRWDATTP